MEKEKVKKVILKKLNIAQLLLIVLTLCLALPVVQAQITPQAANERIAALAPLIAAAPNDDKLYAERATLYFVVGKFDEALSDANKAIQINPKNNGALLARANVKVKKKDYDGAIADYSEVIKLFPTRAARAYFWRGEVYEYKGDYGQALLDYNKAAEIDKSIDEKATLARLRVYEKQAAAQSLAKNPAPPKDSGGNGNSQSAGTSGQSGASQSSGAVLIANMEKLVGYLETLKTLQAVSTPAVEKFRATGEMEYAKLSVNLAELRPKLLAEIAYINKVLPEIRRIDLPQARKIQQTFENTLRGEESLLSKTSDYQVAVFRIRGEQDASFRKQIPFLTEQGNALAAAADAKDKNEKAKWLAKHDEWEAKRIAQVRVTRDITVRGMAELEKYNDPKWQELKPEFQKDIAYYEKDIADYGKKKP